MPRHAVRVEHVDENQGAVVGNLWELLHERKLYGRARKAFNTVDSRAVEQDLFGIWVSKSGDVDAQWKRVRPFGGERNFLGCGAVFLSALQKASSRCVVVWRKE